MKRIIVTWMLALAWLPAFGEGGLRMDYDTTRTAVSRRGPGPPTETVTRERMIAWLMPAALVVRQGDRQLVYDFASRRAYLLDDAQQVSREHSLYAIPGFVEQEIVNREAMARVAAALGISKDVDMVDAESQLSMTQEKPAKVKLKEERSGDTRTYLLNGRATTVLAPSAAQYVERAERLLGEGRGFEALLVTLEYSYATGAVDNGLLTRTSAAAATDARATSVLRPIQIETTEGDSKDALAQLDTVSPEGLEGAAAVHVMRASHQLCLQRGDYALPEFERALAHNPFMVGLFGVEIESCARCGGKR
jgi:hypothetical protein